MKDSIMEKDNCLDIFKKKKFTPLHKAFIKCIEFNYVYPNEIKNILKLIPQNRLTYTLSDLIEYSLVEIDDVFGCLNLTKDYHTILDNLDNIIAIVKLDDDNKVKYHQIMELFERVEMNHPKQLVKLINFRNGK
ncbi:hypothetical protein [Labilibaculum euxinus]